MVPVVDVTKGPPNGYKKINRHSDGMISFHYQRRTVATEQGAVVEDKPIEKRPSDANR